MYFVLSFILYIALFLEKFTLLAKIYTAAGSDGIDKSHHWVFVRKARLIEPPEIEKSAD